MIRRIHFVCPKCGQQKIEEVFHNLVQSSEIIGFDPETDGDNLEYGKTSTTTGDFAQYQCQACRHILKDRNGKIIETPTDLVQWLEKQEIERPLLW